MASENVVGISAELRQQISQELEGKVIPAFRQLREEQAKDVLAGLQLSESFEEITERAKLTSAQLRDFLAEFNVVAVSKIDIEKQRHTMEVELEKNAAKQKEEILNAESANFRVNTISQEEMDKARTQQAITNMKSVEAEDRASRARMLTDAKLVYSEQIQLEKQLADEKDKERRKDTAYMPNPYAAGGSGNNMWEVIRDARAMRFALMEGVVALSMLQIALGEQLPQAAREASRGLIIVADSIMAGAMVGGFKGAVIGGITNALLVFAIALATADPQIAEFNKSLDAMSKKDDVIEGLKKYANVSDDVAQSAIKVMKANSDAAASFRLLKDSAAPTPTILQNIGDILGSTAYNAQLFARYIIVSWSAAEAFTKAMLAGKTVDEARALSLRAAGEAITGMKTGMQSLIEESLKHMSANQKLEDSFKDLDGALSSFSKRDEAANLLARITGLTTEQSRRVLENAGSYKELSTKLAEAEAEYKKYAVAIQDADERGKLTTALLSKQSEAALKMRDAVEEIDRAITDKNILEPLRKALEKSQEEMVKFKDSSDKIASQFSDSWAKAAYDRALADFNASQESIRINRVLKNSLDKDLQDYRDNVDKSNRTLNESLAKQAKELADRKFIIDREYIEKLADIQYDQNKATVDSQQRAIKDERNFADDSIKIYQRLADDLFDLDFNTNENRQKAKTWSEVLEIDRRAVHEREMLTRRKDEGLSDLANRISQAQEEFDTKAKLVDDDYAHKREVAARELVDSIADADRQNDRQLESIRIRSKNELDDLVLRLKREDDLAKLHNKEQLDDLKIRVQDQIAAIDKQYDQEVARIQATDRENTKAHNNRMAEIDMEVAKLKAMASSIGIFGVGMASVSAIITQTGTGGTGVGSGATSHGGIVVPITIQGNIYGDVALQQKIQDALNAVDMALHPFG